MTEYSVWGRYNGQTFELRFNAESFEQARERILIFKASEGEPRIHCNGDATPKEGQSPSIQ